MMILIDNHDELKLVNRLCDLKVDALSFNQTVMNSLIRIVEKMGNMETQTDHEKIMNCLFNFEDGLCEDVLSILGDFGFKMD